MNKPSKNPSYKNPDVPPAAEKDAIGQPRENYPGPAGDTGDRGRRASPGPQDGKPEKPVVPPGAGRKGAPMIDPDGDTDRGSIPGPDTK